ncbi:MAG: SRPBCC domain-containing protein, partial [Actinomycetia bacterium]|nr:SRPBCC domain-containing protein [Actinomycetes bacterium]
MRHQLKTEITIGAPIEEVWAVLTDLDSFPEWNPFMTAAAGVVAEGERLEVT